MSENSSPAGTTAHHVCGSRMHVWGTTYSCLSCDRAWLEAHRIPVLMVRYLTEGYTVRAATTRVADTLCLTEERTKQYWYQWRHEHAIKQTGRSGVLVEHS